MMCSSPGNDLETNILPVKIKQIAHNIQFKTRKKTKNTEKTIVNRELKALDSQKAEEGVSP